jgi:hypothetical protein
MEACTFFGHRDAPKSLEPVLRDTLLDLIENHAVQTFYVGSQGAFDAMVRRQLSALEKTHGIRYYVVLAYLPQKHGLSEQDAHTLFPEGLELVPPRYAICRRNLWMLEQSRFVVTYVRRDVGGAARFKCLAEKKGRIVFTV